MSLHAKCISGSFYYFYNLPFFILSLIPESCHNIFTSLLTGVISSNIRHSPVFHVALAVGIYLTPVFDTSNLFSMHDIYFLSEDYSGVIGLSLRSIEMDLYDQFQTAIESMAMLYDNCSKGL